MRRVLVISQIAVMECWLGAFSSTRRADFFFYAADAVFGHGVRGEHFWRAVAFGRFSENLHEFQHAARVVASFDHVVDSSVIRFQLIGAAEAQLNHLICHLRGGSGTLGTARIITGADTECRGQDLTELTLRHMFGRVAMDNMSDFVTEDGGELIFVGHLVEKRAGDEDLAAGQGEGVDRARIVHEMEAEWIWAFSSSAVGDYFLADACNALCLGIGRRNDATHLRTHLWSGLSAESDFLLHA